MGTLDFTRLIILSPRPLVNLNDLRADDTVTRCGCRGTTDGLIIVVTGVLGVVFEESDSDDQQFVEPS